MTQILDENGNIKVAVAFWHFCTSPLPIVPSGDVQ